MSSETAPGPPELQVVSRRREVLDLLQDGVTEKRILERRVDFSRATLDRAMRELDDRNLVEYADGDWEVTQYGSLALTAYERLVEQYEKLSRVEPLLRYLPRTVELDLAAVEGADVFLSESPAPHEPLVELDRRLANVETLRALVPVVLPKFVDLFHTHVLARQIETRLVLDREAERYLDDTYSDEMAAIEAASNVSIAWEADPIPLSVVVMDDEATWLGVHDDRGNLRGAMVSDDASLVSWATDEVRRCGSDEEDVGPAADTA